MELTEAQLQTALNTLRAAWTDRACEACRSSEWSLSANVMELQPYGPSASQMTFATYPVVMALCDRCGRVQLVSAERLGIIRQERS